MDALTITSLVLEITGFSLAVVETVWPDTADKIEIWIDKKSEGLSNINMTKVIKNWAKDQDDKYETADVVFGIIGLLMIILLTWIDPFGLSTILGLFVYWGISILVIGWFLAASSFFIEPVWKFLGWVFKRLDTLAHNRALGAFGLILAFLGVIFQIIDSF